MTSPTGLQRIIGRFFDDPNQKCPLVILGVTYGARLSPPPFDVALMFRGETYPHEFIAAIHNQLWFTYRSGFPLIPRAINGPSPVSLSSYIRNMGDVDPTGFTSDAGWGCMIRTAQSLLATALSRQHPEVIGWFLDKPLTPFSIHRFVSEGGRSGKKPGEWFGPNAAGRSIRALCEAFPTCGLRVLVSETGDFYRNEIEPLLGGPVLLLISLRLGIEQINPVYYESVLTALSLPQAVGIAGGRPSSSYYFFGHQGTSLFYLDPHTIQPAGSAIESFHTRLVAKIPLLEMDPSMLVGFLLTDRADWDRWVTLVAESKIFHVNELAEPSFQPSISYISDGDGDDFVDLGGVERVAEIHCGGEFEEVSGVEEPVVVGRLGLEKSLLEREKSDLLFVVEVEEGEDETKGPVKRHELDRQLDHDRSEDGESLVLLSAPGSPVTRYITGSGSVAAIRDEGMVVVEHTPLEH